MSIKELHFFNCAGHGDVHLSRGFCKQIIEFIKPATSFYFTKASDSRFSDICETKHISEILKFIPEYKFVDPHMGSHPDNLATIPLVIDKKNDRVFLNTWLGGLNEAKIPKEDKIIKGCTFNKHLHIYIQSLGELVKHKLIDKEEEILSIFSKDNYLKLLPTIDFNHHNISICKKRFITNPIILIDNADPTSNQSALSDDIINSFPDICASFAPEIDIVCLNRVNSNLKNVHCLDDFFTEPTNLNHFAYLSLFASVIIGRSSGPYCHCLNKENLMNESKLFICFSKYKSESSWIPEQKVKCKFVWSRNYTHESAKEDLLTSVQNHLNIKTEALNCYLREVSQKTQDKFTHSLSTKESAEIFDGSLKSNKLLEKLIQANLEIQRNL